MNTGANGEKRDLLSPEDEERDGLIAEVIARCELAELRSLPMTTLQRAGAFMLAALRTDGRLYALALDENAGVIGEQSFEYGPRWEPQALAEALASFAADIPSERLIIGIGGEVGLDSFILLERMFTLLKDKGVRLIDVIEVRGHGYRSILPRSASGSSGR